MFFRGGFTGKSFGFGKSCGSDQGWKFGDWSDKFGSDHHFKFGFKNKFGRDDDDDKHGWGKKFCRDDDDDKHGWGKKFGRDDDDDKHGWGGKRGHHKDDDDKDCNKYKSWCDDKDDKEEDDCDNAEDPTYGKVFFGYDFDDSGNPSGGYFINAEEPDENPYGTPSLPEGTEPTFDNYLAYFEEIGGDVTQTEAIVFYEEAEDGTLTEAFRVEAPEGGFTSSDDVLEAYEDALEENDYSDADLVTAISMDETCEDDDAEWDDEEQDDYECAA